jgi:hypothetical protein
MGSGTAKTSGDGAMNPAYSLVAEVGNVGWMSESAKV